MSKPLVYICSPCRGNYEMNIDNAISYSRAAFTRGYIPITPHIYFTRFMNDENSKERSMAMVAGLQLLLMCSEIWVFGLDNPSEGMQAEIAFAIRHGITIRDGMEMISKKATEEHATPTDFVSLKEMLRNAPTELVAVRKEENPCQSTETMRAIWILPHRKR